MSVRQRCRFRHRDPAAADEVHDLVPHEHVILVPSDGQRRYFTAVKVVNKPDGTVDEVVYDEDGIPRG